jgi:hypothetical protein
MILLYNKILLYLRSNLVGDSEAWGFEITWELSRIGYWAPGEDPVPLGKLLGVCRKPLGKLLWKLLGAYRKHFVKHLGKCDGSYGPLPDL